MEEFINEKLMTVRDLIQYLETLPQDAELFYYGVAGGFLSLDSIEEVIDYFKLSDDGRTLYIDHVRYEIEDEDRIAQGKEWAEMLRSKES